MRWLLFQSDRWRGLVFALGMLLAWMGSGRAELELNKLITVAGDASFPPYEFLEERNGLKLYRGFNIDLIQAVIEKTNHDVQFIPMLWDEAVRALQDGRVDAISGMKYSEERARLFDFSNEYLINSLAIFVQKETSIIAEMEDLFDKRVAVVKGDYAFEKIRKWSLNLTVATSQEEAIRMLVAGKVDAVLANRMVGQYLLQRLGAVESVKIVGGIIDPERYSFAVRPGNHEILAAFNEGLRKIKKDGVYDRIYFKWFGETLDYPAAYYKKYIWYLLGGLGITLTVIFIFARVSYLLRREVENRTQQIRRYNEELVEKNQYIRILLNSVQALVGRPSPVLRIESRDLEKCWHLCITDNGPGIPSDAREKVFDPFFTTKTGGTGLGLFVSYQLARRNSVDIQLDSTPGVGTTVCLIFSKETEALA